MVRNQAKSAATISVPLSGGESVDFPNIVPQQPEKRRKLTESVKIYLSDKDALPPLRRKDILQLTDEFISRTQTDEKLRLVLSILIHNQLNLEPLLKIPLSRRLLLLPHCLRNRAECRGEFDDLGLLCASCGACPLGALVEAAEEAGWLVLVSEGTGSAAQLVKSGAVEGLVGVGCLSSLAKIQQKIGKAAIPSLAVPLLNDGCVNTEVDAEEVMSLLQLPYQKNDRVSLGNLRKTIRNYFREENLREKFALSGRDAETLALDAILDGGRRWRPYLCAAVYRSLSRRSDYSPTVEEQLCLAVESFHKASLVHDDIEDHDVMRDNYRTLTAKAGTGRSLNAGDWLIGNGYRLLGSLPLPPQTIAVLVSEASRAHLRLCAGQGDELYASENGSVPDRSEILRIYKDKTSAAFEVSLLLGALAAGAEENVLNTLGNLAGDLGLYYQIRDDLSDKDKETSLFLSSLDKNGDTDQIEKILLNLEEQVYATLNNLKNSSLKTFLFRLTAQVVKSE